MRSKFIKLKSLKNNMARREELMTELERSMWIRSKFGLPNTGKVSHQLVANGYGEFREVRIRHDGVIVKVVRSSDGLPSWITKPGR